MQQQLSIPLNDVAALHAPLGAELDAALRGVLGRAQFDWGPEVPAFEAELARWLGARHAIGVNSGTAGLKLALRALGIGPGDEVITAPNSDLATTAAIHHVGATAIWADVEPDTMNLSPEAAEAAITPRTRAILPVHLYGHPADMPALTAIARRYGLAVVEDSCLALGASVEGRPAGRWGDLAVFSHSPSKHLGAMGCAGSVVTDDEALAERVRLYAGYGQQRARSYHRGLSGLPQEMLVEGYNERLDELQAAVLRVKLPHLAGWIDARREHAAAYTAALAGSAARAPVERPGCRHSYRNYVVRVPERERVQARLSEAGVSTGLLYVPPLHLQPALAGRGLGRGAFPIAEAACDELLALPLSPALQPAQRDAVIAALLATLDG